MDYYSITSRMEKIKSQPKDTVNAGDVIGYAGDVATLFDKGIYFEIRHNTEPEDPLNWITMQGLTGRTHSRVKTILAGNLHFFCRKNAIIIIV